MVGRVDAICAITDQLQALSYCEVETAQPTILGPAGTRYRGHQFRHARLESTPAGGSLRVRRFPDGEAHLEGWGGPRVLASWVHAAFASCPELADHLVRA
jgi:cobyrinic acid a,c-diamide synthase